jgi:hypothetical protein
LGPWLGTIPAQQHGLTLALDQLYEQALPLTVQLLVAGKRETFQHRFRKGCKVPGAYLRHIPI